MFIRQSKILILFLTTAIIAMSVGQIFPDKALAQGIPVYDNASVIELGLIKGSLVDIGVSGTHTSVSTAADSASNKMGWIQNLQNWLKTQALQALRDAIVKRIVDMMTDQIVQWIQGGGKPQFVTDWQGFLKGSVSAAVGDVVQQAGLGVLCKPFGLQIQLALLPVKKFSQRVTCTLDDIVSNINNFYIDFSVGNWAAYEASLMPENNFYGTLYMTEDEMAMAAAQAKEASQNEAQAGKGFLSVKKCVHKDSSGNCDQYTITTPGDTVGQVVAHAINAQTDWAVNVQGVVSAIVNAAINRLMTEGLSLMTGSQSQGQGNNITPTEYQSAIAQNLESQKTQVIQQYQQFLSAELPILSLKERTLSNAQIILTALTSLKSANCQPAVADEDIANAQSDATYLQIDVNNRQTAVAQINAAIAQIQGVTTDSDGTQMNTALNTYNNFSSQHQDLFQDVSNPNNLANAQNEENTFQTNASAAQNRLNACPGAPKATSTQP